ncbi:sodium-coupled neutral amino acid transporter 7-like [Macrosteles quadrilineatus]|uniref:sodium-coupled neutral amino acid transporter 7-like n=1 Tax=Macrosteles quadrilineatus TaxID=74068 RepID=UPI0023E0F39E|nr:sodium-coupled neutral amino acid transporter 7-like [Macrosteles quadrilineatus]
MDDGHEIESLDSSYPYQPSMDSVLSTIDNARHNGNSVAGGNDEITSSTSSSSDSIAGLVISERGESSRLAAVFLLVNAALGAGLLNFPQAFDQAGGITVALLVQLVLVCCVCFGLLVLAHSSWHVHAATLYDTVAGTCGSKGSLLCSLLIALYCFGTCVTFLIIIGDQFDRVLMSLVGPNFCHTWFMNRQFTITASSAIFILPLCYSRKIDFLKYASSLGVLAVLYVVGLVVVQHYTGDFIPGPIKTSPTHWTDVFYVVPVICFGYQCHVSVVPIYSCMRDRRTSSFTIVVVTTLVICGLAYSLTGTYGYLTFGSHVSSDILQDYGAEKVAVLVGIVAIAVKTVTTYPILLFCGREAVTNVWCGIIHDWDPCKEKLRRIVISSVWLIATILLAVVAPGIGIVIDALGSLAAVFIFIFPGLCLLQTCLKRDPCLMATRMQWYVTIAVVFVAVGTFVLGVVLVQTLERMFSPEPEFALCT